MWISRDLKGVSLKIVTPQLLPTQFRLLHISPGLASFDRCHVYFNSVLLRLLKCQHSFGHEKMNCQESTVIDS